MIEIWKDIIRYETLYQVSNLGRVKRENKIRSHTSNGNGYLKVILYKNNIPKKYFIHRLIAEYFIPNPDNKPFVNHKDGSRDNNSIENLEWCNQSENTLHSINLNNTHRGISNYAAKLTEEQILEIRNLISLKVLHQDIAVKYNIHKSTVSGIATKRIWKHI